MGITSLILVKELRAMLASYADSNDCYAGYACKLLYNLNLNSPIVAIHISNQYYDLYTQIYNGWLE